LAISCCQLELGGINLRTGAKLAFIILQHSITAFFKQNVFEKWRLSKII
jgi:hypothetical protein